MRCLSLLTQHTHTHTQAQPASAHRRCTSPTVWTLTMAEGGEGEDEIQFLRTVSVSLLLLEQNTGAAVSVHCVFLLGSVSVRACVLWCGLGVYRIKGWQLLHIEVTGQGVRIMLTGDQGVEEAWKRTNRKTGQADERWRTVCGAAVIVHKKELSSLQSARRRWCCVLGGCGAQCGADWQHEACNICCTSFQQDWTSLFGRLMRWNQSVICQVYVRGGVALQKVAREWSRELRVFSFLMKGTDGLIYLHRTS